MLNNIDFKKLNFNIKNKQNKIILNVEKMKRSFNLFKIFISSPLKEYRNIYIPSQIGI